MDLALPLLALGGGLTAVLIVGRSPEPWPRSRQWLLGAFFGGATALLLLAQVFRPELRNLALLAASALAGGVFLGETALDLRSRLIDLAPILVAIVLVGLLGILADGLVGPLLGLTVAGVLAGLYFGSGWLFVRLRGIGTDPETGAALEMADYGVHFGRISGTVWAASLVVVAALAVIFGDGLGTTLRGMVRLSARLGELLAHRLATSPLALLILGLVVLTVAWLIARVVRRLRRRQVGKDLETGGAVEGFGGGDVVIWALVGIWLGSLAAPFGPAMVVTLVIWTFLVQIFVNAGSVLVVMAASILARQSAQARRDLAVPMLPSIVAASVAAVVWLARIGG
jgi:hypothetical protein